MNKNENANEKVVTTSGKPVEETKQEKRLRPLPPEYTTLLISSCASSLSTRA